MKMDVVDVKDRVAMFAARGRWDAPAYFEWLLDRNRLAVENRFSFCRVSGLQGLEDMLHLMQDSQAFFAVSDISDGYLSLSNAARRKKVLTFFLAIRHAESDMEERADCFDVMHELFRQLMTVLARDRMYLMRFGVVVDDRVTFSEIERYFFSGCACAFFQISVDSSMKFCVCDDEWTEKP